MNLEYSNAAFTPSPAQHCWRASPIRAGFGHSPGTVLKKARRVRMGLWHNHHIARCKTSEDQCDAWNRAATGPDPAASSRAGSNPLRSKHVGTGRRVALGTDERDFPAGSDPTHRARLLGFLADVSPELGSTGAS